MRNLVKSSKSKETNVVIPAISIKDFLLNTALFAYIHCIEIIGIGIIGIDIYFLILLKSNRYCYMSL